MYQEVTADTFGTLAEAASDSNGARGLSATIPTDATHYAVHSDGLSGYALRGDELCGVFSHASVKGRLSGILADAENVALRSGFHALRLDCFEGLAPVYRRHGFRETSRLAWDWAYAPDGWTDTLGTPSVVFMERPLSVEVAA
jgi:hypothetical protein